MEAWRTRGSIAPFAVPFDRLTAWYRAYDAFTRIVRDPQNHYAFRLAPGALTPAPRPIDLDVLLYGDQIIDEPSLIVPHPRLLERPFVRIPLADVATPGLRHPVTGAPLDRAAADPGVRRL